MVVLLIYANCCCLGNRGVRLAGGNQLVDTKIALGETKLKKNCHVEVVVVDPFFLIREFFLEIITTAVIVICLLLFLYLLL